MTIRELLFNYIPYSFSRPLYYLFLKFRYDSARKDIIKRLGERKDSNPAFMEMIHSKPYLCNIYGEWADEIERRHFNIKRDMANGYLYYDFATWKNKTYKMYFPKSMRKPFVERYLAGIFIEQDERSPHFYLSDRVKEKLSTSDGIVVDMGAAEGNFLLEAADGCSQCICFEPDKDWREVLDITRMELPCSVIIRHEFISSENKEPNATSLDAFLENHYGYIPSDIKIIKMDIEGAEQDALKGMEKTLKKNRDVLLLICCYHSSRAADEIVLMLDEWGFKSYFRNGFILFYQQEGFGSPDDYPYFRQGVIEGIR